MTEWKLFESDVPFVSTKEFHLGRPRAAHLEEEPHRFRLKAAAAAVATIAEPGDTVSDLGCGDGGLLQLLKDVPVKAWGYDFHGPNSVGWPERGVDGYIADVFGEDWDRIRFGYISILTEVLEHLHRPHRVLHELPSRWVVATSPQYETDVSHCGEHAWAWDMDGYRNLFEQAGWFVEGHTSLGWSQLMIARRW